MPGDRRRSRSLFPRSVSLAHNATQNSEKEMDSGFSGFGDDDGGGRGGGYSDEPPRHSSMGRGGHGR